MKSQLNPSSIPLCSVLLLPAVKEGLYLPLLPPPHLCQIRHENHKSVVEGDEGDEYCDVAVAVGEGVAVLHVLKGGGGTRLVRVWMSWEWENCRNNISGCTYV